MQDLCPLCLKKGVKRRVKLLQINLQEGVWICEEEKCIWPFGYEGFVFCPRIVGKIWSCYWDDHKSTPKLKLCSSSALPIISPNLMTNHSKSINTANPIKINNDTDVLQNMCQESQILPSENKGEYNVNTEAISNPDRSNDSLLLIDDCTEGTKIKNEFINSIAKEFKREDDSCTQRNHQNTNSLRGIPKITSIEKTNIDISNVTENEISVTSCKNECEQFTSPTNVTCDYTSGQENISQDISLMNTSVNIDTVLDDFLSNDYSVTEDINDDWINSLLT
ncbi:hypothetical protein WN55_02899 [Dufourea novaeangliae]|uniref:Uncharacterized protein n=1 Tax=Dufourea novaeangliae TaxID=178035 RepID=A0A154PII4_DUFNO|nr:hypothetical protein WN55_02899 [Dufourea novaeangliae]